MNDIAVQFRIKNGRLLRALRASPGFESVARFSREHGLIYQQVNDLLCMRVSPILKWKGEWSRPALGLAQALNVEPGELWPTELQVVLRRNNGEFEVSLDEARAIAARPEGAVIDRQTLLLLASTLKPREAEILAGFANNVTLGDLGNRLGISPERVRQIQMNAIRKMQHHARCEDIRFNDVIEVS